MTDCTVAAPVRATKAPARSKAAPSPAPTQPPLSEGNRLAIEAAEVLQGMVGHVLYADHDKPRNLQNSHLDRVDDLLNLLVNPEDIDRETHDPARGDVHEHLAHISAEMESALEVMQLADLPNYGPSEHAVFTAVIECGFNFADRLFLAYRGLPGTLEDLRTLTTSAGARPHRDRPTPPIRRTDESAETQAGYRHRARDIQQVFETLSTQSEAARDFCIDIRARLQGSNSSVVEACNDLTILQHLVAFMGATAEEMSGMGNFIGGPASWATMDGIEAIGGAA